MRGLLRTSQVLIVLVLAAFVPMVAAGIEDGELVGPVGVAAAGSPPASFPGKVFFVNGIRTEGRRAVQQAEATGTRLGCPDRTYLVYNDMTSPLIDGLNVALSKVAGSDAFNEAFDTLLQAVREEIEAGRPAAVVCYSAGSIITNDCMHALAETYAHLPAEQRAALLGRIHILIVGGACLPQDHCLADGWPTELGSLHRIFDKADAVSQWFGEGDLNEDSDEEAHSYLNHYLLHIMPEMLEVSGKTVLGRKP